MKGYLVFKDGRRREMDKQYVGCLRHHVPTKGPNGTILETVFEAEPEIVDGCVLYLEKETIDITERMAEARRQNEERRWAVIRKGLGVDE